MLNIGQRIHAWYIVGEDHYRLTDKNGNPDTLPKIERNMTARLFGFNPQMHQISMAFVRRDGHIEEVPTKLEFIFLPNVPFESSSSSVRKGRHAFMPFTAYDYIRREGLGLYGISPN